MKTLHDIMREDLRKRVQTPEPSTASEERTQTEKLPEKKKVSSGLMPSFQYRETEGVPSVPRLSDMAVRMSGCKNPLTATLQDAEANKLRSEMGETRRNRISLEDREQFYGLISWARQDAITTLGALAMYDEALTVEQADTLLAVAEIISSAEVIKP